MDSTLSLIIELLVSLATMIPLVIELVKYIQKAVKEKNWQNMIKLAISLMTEAEEKFAKGADRKEWVMAMIELSASSINYELDKQALSALIDNLVALTKVVNIATVAEKVEDEEVEETEEFDEVVDDEIEEGNEDA